MMKQTYRITGMTCQHCVHRVKRSLENIKGVKTAHVTLQPPQAVVTMHHQISPDVLEEAVKKAGNYGISKIVDQDQAVPAPAKDPGDIDTIKRHRKDHKAGNHGSHGRDHHRMMIKDFKNRFWISLILTVPILLLSPMIQGWIGLEWQFAGSMPFLFGLSSLVYFYGGWPFLKGAVHEIKGRAPGMMTLIAMAISVAYFYSSATVFGLPGKDFFWELATLIVIMLIGHWIEMKSVLGASRALEQLVSMMPSEAHRIEDEDIRDIRVSELRSGDLILVKPGEKIPADGVVMEGESYLNESMLTGESKPVKRTKNDRVIGGSVNGNGSLKVEVEHTGEESYLNKVIIMVRDAQQTKSRMQNLSDRAAKWLTYFALTAGFGTLIVWLSLGREFEYALERMVTVMVISCPHALGLAIPLVVAISTAVSAQHGLLIRNRTAFEEARKISVIVFDKTGTLTRGAFNVTRYESLSASFEKDEILKLAAALEQHSEHPVATGIMQKIHDREISIPTATHFEAITGKGVQADVNGMQIKVVSPGYLEEMSISVPERVIGNSSETVVFLLANGELAGFIALADEIRPESADAIRILKENKIKVYMATGDNHQVAKAVSDKLGLDDYYAEVLPHEKLKIIQDLQTEGAFVAMTGDGVNDAPALAQANIGIAVGSGSDVAAETADIILVNSNPRDIANLILFGRATHRKMIQNLAWATGYNAIAIPLAAGILYPVGFVLSPAVGAVLMSLSTIIVALNAQRLKGQMN